MTVVLCSAEAGPRVVAIAQRWIGTPYRHQASREGVGADCLGLVRGIWREIYGVEPEPMPAYTPDWAEATGEERLIAAALRHMAEVPEQDARPGDLCLFRMRDRGIAKHAAILVSGPVAAGRIVHAYSGHAVCETGIGAPWARRLAGLFRFPPIETTQGSDAWQR